MSVLSQRSREGYLLVDHRFSPGLPEDVAKAAGYDPAQCGEGKLFEAKSLTCSHCKVVVIVNPLRVRARERCEKCDHYVCDLCAKMATLPDYSHLPYDKFVDLTMDGKFGTLMELLTLNEVL